MRNINEIVVHCAATPEGKHFDVKDIDAWHKKRGWSGIGYHYVILLDGTVEKGRPVERQGAHVRGRNKNTIGICYIGGVAKDGKTAKDTRTPAQKVAMKALLEELLEEHPKVSKISGHNQYAAKACPSFNAKDEYKALTVRNKKPLWKSRTVQGSTTAAGLTATQLVEPIKNITNTLGDQQGNIASGDLLSIGIGVIIILGAVYALYARWDDGGRPTPW